MNSNLHCCYYYYNRLQNTRLITPILCQGRERDLCKGETKMIGEVRTFGVGRVGQVIRRKLSHVFEWTGLQPRLAMHGNNPRADARPVTISQSESRQKISQIWWELLAASAECWPCSTGDPSSFLWSGGYSVSRRTQTAAEESRSGSFALTQLVQALLRCPVESKQLRDNLQELSQPLTITRIFVNYDYVSCVCV
jgi:hypothetical protein